MLNGSRYRLFVQKTNKKIKTPESPRCRGVTNFSRLAHGDKRVIHRGREFFLFPSVQINKTMYRGEQRETYKSWMTKSMVGKTFSTSREIPDPKVIANLDVECSHAITDLNFSVLAQVCTTIYLYQHIKFVVSDLR